MKMYFFLCSLQQVCLKIGYNKDAMSMYNVTLDQLIKENFTKIITGDQPMDSFDGFVEQWKTLGGDEITAEVNAAIGN